MSHSTVPHSEENELIKARHDHLATLVKQGIDPYPSVSERSHTLAQARQLWEENEAAWAETPGRPSADALSITVAGRMVALRSHGGATFADIEDESGKLQLLAEASHLGDDYSMWELFDLGDFIQCVGQLFITKRGEVTLHVDACTLLSKSLRPLPDKWSGLEDTEKRYRERYADLIANPEVRERFRTRSLMVRQLRSDLESAGFMEVETPVLQTIAGGATAKPFMTHYNAYDTDVFLRIAPELYHKRLIVGGFEQVYEFARVFRNEGVDHTHNPEFTDLEFYAAYWDYHQMMDFCEQLVKNVVQAVYGTLEFQFKDHRISVEHSFARITFHDAVHKAVGIDLNEEDEHSLRAKLHDLKIEAPPHADFGKLCDYLYKAKVRPGLVQPTFLIDHPIELSPLAKKSSNKTVQRFQLIMAGEFELCNAFTELNDPIDQKARFEQQAALKERGDEEAQPYDADYIRALEYGMPPTAGFGMGIDRFVALLTDSHSLREIILFPFMRPKGTDA